MGLNSYQVTFKSYGNHYQIYGRDIQDVMGGVTGGAGVYGQAVGEAGRPLMLCGARLYIITYYKYQQVEDMG